MHFLFCIWRMILRQEFKLAGALHCTTPGLFVFLKTGAFLMARNNWSERASIQSFEGVRTWNWSLCSVESIALQSELKISDFRQVWENLTMPYFLVSPQYYIISEVWIMRWLVGALLLLGTVARGEDEAEGEDGVQFEDDTIYRAVIESCSGWRLNKVCEVWNMW